MGRDRQGLWRYGEADKVELTEDQYNAGVKSLPARGGKGKKPADKT